MDSERPLFIGLTHIGQIFSIGWVSKIGECSAYDFDQKNLINFKNKNFTNEEISLTKYKSKIKKIKFLNKDDEIKKYSNIFFTYDTHLSQNGVPSNLNNEKKLLKLISLAKQETNIYVLSQNYPGYLEKIKKKVKKKINLIYMVDTLQMGNALDIFLKPNQLIFGIDNDKKKIRKNIAKIFNKFTCKKYFLSIYEAETIKSAINIYLYFSVSFSNLFDSLLRSKHKKYFNIIECLKNDSRIGKFAYLKPNLGISGGHLERDIFFLKKLIPKKKVNLIKSLEELNNSRIQILFEQIKLQKKNKILIIGKSYKKNSYSFTNSIFKKIEKIKKYKISYYDQIFKKGNTSLLSSMKKNDIFIFNYAKKKEIITIKNFLKKYKKKKLINISYENFNSSDNCINIF
tara:strand:+ start:1118 stop:2317 length:1200 start_codon:yes stop_codon:yes gene_type:complete